MEITISITNIDWQKVKLGFKDLKKRVSSWTRDGQTIFLTTERCTRCKNSAERKKSRFQGVLKNYGVEEFKHREYSLCLKSQELKRCHCVWPRRLFVWHLLQRGHAEETIRVGACFFKFQTRCHTATACFKSLDWRKKGKRQIHQFFYLYSNKTTDW